MRSARWRGVGGLATAARSGPRRPGRPDPPSRRRSRAARPARGVKLGQVPRPGTARQGRHRRGCAPGARSRHGGAPAACQGRAGAGGDLIARKASGMASAWRSSSARSASWSRRSAVQPLQRRLSKRGDQGGVRRSASPESPPRAAAPRPAPRPAASSERGSQRRGARRLGSGLPPLPAAAGRAATGAAGLVPNSSQPQALDLLAVMAADRGVGDARQMARAASCPAWRGVRGCRRRGLRSRAATAGCTIGCAASSTACIAPARLAPDQIVGVHAAGQDGKAQRPCPASSSGSARSITRSAARMPGRVAVQRDDRLVVRCARSGATGPR